MHPEGKSKATYLMNEQCRLLISSEDQVSEKRICATFGITNVLELYSGV
jgi:hypothetical protein